MTSAAGQGVSLAGRYRLDKLIAPGAAGQVWRALDLLLERNVAVKLLRPDAAGDQEARARFRAEARNASRLSHPGVAQVYDYGEDGSPDLPFLVMELVDGPSLAEVLAAGPLDPGRTMDLIAQVGDGLHAAHSGGLVHRDIKPANLLITGDGQVKITDFGIASVTPGAPSAATGILLGTPAYLAPERTAGRPATPASDLYSLGVVGYECLTGAPPFRGPALQVAEAHLQCPFPALPATVPAEVAALVAALTAKNPRNRPGSAREVAERAGKLRTAGKIARPAAISPIPASGCPPAAPCLTLSDIGAQATQAGQPAFGGQQPRAVLADLRRLGLRPRLAWVPAPAQPPGTVLSVQPGGALPPGTVVTVAVAAQPAQQGDQTRDGGDGNGGNGGGGGGGGSDGGGGDGGGNGRHAALGRGEFGMWSPCSRWTARCA